MELINRGGQSFFVPVEQESSSVISNFSKWEQAFRVYMNVYTKEHPHRAAELIQYNHIIFRWFKFTLKPPYSIAHDNLRLAIWDTSFWTFWLKFGHKGP